MSILGRIHDGYCIELATESSKHGNRYALTQASKQEASERRR